MGALDRSVYPPTHPPTHPPIPNPQQLIRTASFTSLQPTHPPTSAGYLPNDREVAAHGIKLPTGPITALSLQQQKWQLWGNTYKKEE